MSSSVSGNRVVQHAQPAIQDRRASQEFLDQLAEDMNELFILNAKIAVGDAYQDLKSKKISQKEFDKISHHEGTRLESLQKKLDPLKKTETKAEEPKVEAAKKEKSILDKFKDLFSSKGKIGG